MDNNGDVLLEDVNSNLMIKYEIYLKNCGVCPNSCSYYMRNLRAIYNRAVEKELTQQQYPFKYVYTGIDKTVKRAVSLKTIRQIQNLDLSTNPLMDYARDIFMFSFYTRGMSFIDMAYLKRKICRMEFCPIADIKPTNNCSLSGKSPCKKLSINITL